MDLGLCEIFFFFFFFIFFFCVSPDNYDYIPWRDEELWQWAQWLYWLQSHQDTNIHHKSLHTLEETLRLAPAALDSCATAGRRYPQAISSVLAPTDRELSHWRCPSPEPSHTHHNQEIITLFSATEWVLTLTSHYLIIIIITIITTRMTISIYVALGPNYTGS